MPSLKLAFTANDTCHLNGTLTRRIAVLVDGQQKRIDRLALDSAIARGRFITGIVNEYGVDRDDATTQLEALNIEAMAAAQAMRQAANDGGERIRLSRLADEWLAKLGPKYHRKARSIYLEAAGREVAVSGLWKLATDSVVDDVFKTQEGLELAKDAGKPGYAKLLGLFKDAAAMAAERIIKTLPELNHVDSRDPMSDSADLVARLVLWLLEQRTHRTDNGTAISFSIWDWARSIEPGRAWLKCHDLPVFGRIKEGSARPEVAVKGEFLKAALRAESIRRLKADLSADGLAVTEVALKSSGQAWRVWQFTDRVMDSVAVGCATGSEE